MIGLLRLSLLGLALLFISDSSSRAFADETNPILSVETNAGSFYYPGNFPGDKVLWKAPLLCIRTNLTPFISYWATHCQEIRGIRGTTPEVLCFSKMIIPEVVTKSIPEQYFTCLDYSVDGSISAFLPVKECRSKNLLTASRK